METDIYRKLYVSGQTRKGDFRKSALLKLKTGLEAEKESVIKSLSSDLGKSRQECALIFSGFAIHPLISAIKLADEFGRPVWAPPVSPFLISAGQILREPYGVVTIRPDVRSSFFEAYGLFLASLACGNCTVLVFAGKMSSTQKRMSELVNSLLPEGFGRIADEHERTGVFVSDLIFRGEAMRGKVPAILDAGANAESAAKKIVYAWRRAAGITAFSPQILFLPELTKTDIIRKIDKWAARYPGDGNPKQLPVKTWRTLEELIPALAASGVPPALYLFSDDDKVREDVLSKVPFGAGAINDAVIRPANMKLLMEKFSYRKTLLIR